MWNHEWFVLRSNCWWGMQGTLQEGGLIRLVTCYGVAGVLLPYPLGIVLFGGKRDSSRVLWSLGLLVWGGG